MAVGGVLVAAGVVSLPSAVTRDLFGGRAAATTRYLTDVVKRAPFRLTVRERGTVDSLKSVTLTSKVEGTTTIISIVPEGTQVKEGDLLVELDASTLVETEKTQQIAVTTAEAALKKAQEGLEIQKRQNESDIAAADLALVLAELDLKKYIEGEYPQLEAEQQGLVQVAREDKDRAKKVYEFSQRLAQKGYTSQNQLESDRIALAKADINLKAAEDKLRVLRDFTKERTIRELTEKAEEAKRARERVERQGIAALAQFEADVDAAELTLKVEQEKLERARTQIANSKIYAPQAGEVVYAQEEDRRGDGSTVIAEGSTVRERQAIINLPDLTQMKVEARIHESLVSRVRPDLPVRIRVDAVPGKVFTGTVLSISSVPLSGDWMRPDLKEYECNVSIDYTPGEDAQLKPGLTAEVEIIVQERDDVLQVPFQSVV
ncbi:MAG TPA: efflux RND transporter periplasmic adaptor subunit, partial [Planctomycetaceae bacterium]